MLEAVFQPFPMLPARRAQVWRHRPEFRRPRHFHREPELNFVVKGSATLGVGTRVQHAVAGDVVVFEPGQDHVLLDASDDLELFALALTPELWQRRGAADAGTPLQAEALSHAEQARVAEALRAMADLCDPLSVETRVTDVFCRLRTLARTPSSVSRRAALGVLAQPGASCSTLASQLGTHPSHLSRVVTRDLGVPLVELRSRLKLSEFVRLVDAGQSFTRAALQADFGSYAQCHRVFRRFTGCPPRDYFAGARAQVDLATATRKAGFRV